MYERFFGLTAPPFQINPDPDFYYESRVHGSAHQYLRFGAFQGEGFIVVTGDIGAGKTTLLRTLLNELDPAKVVAAHIVSTQLDASELLVSVALNFGVATKDLDKAQLLAALEAHFVSLAKTNRRALLIIDEAQNLSRTTIEELRMLSNLQFRNKALLQSFLVGQPELRNLMRLPGMEQLRQRVIASCHLGPMDVNETRGYVEHRLGRVGWAGRPKFEDAAYIAISRWSGGVPRRINTLCNRLLLSTFLDGADFIDRSRVERVAREIRAEINGLNDASMSMDNGSRGTITEPARDPEADVAFDIDAGMQRMPRTTAVRNLAHPRNRYRAEPSALQETDTVMAVAASQCGLVIAAALLRAFAQRDDLPAARLVQIIGPEALPDAAAAAADATALGLPGKGWLIETAARSSSERQAELFAAYLELFTAARPSVIVVCDDDNASLLCAIAAAQIGIPVAHVNAGRRNIRRRMNLTTPRERSRLLIDHAASLLYACEHRSLTQLLSEGAPASCVSPAGNPLIDGLRYALPHCKTPAETLKKFGASRNVLDHPKGFILIYFEHWDEVGDPATWSEVIVNLRLIGRMIGLVWPIQPRVHAACANTLDGDDSDSPIAVMPPLDYFEMLGLVRAAACVLTDSLHWHDQAVALNIPSLSLVGQEDTATVPSKARDHSVRQGMRRIFRELSEILGPGGKRQALPEMWDGHAAERISKHLSSWLRITRQATDRRYREKLAG